MAVLEQQQPDVPIEPCDHHGAKNPYVFTVTGWRPFSFLAQDDLAA
jgi:hypothetical protein